MNAHLAQSMAADTHRIWRGFPLPLAADHREPDNLVLFHGVQGQRRTELIGVAQLHFELYPSLGLARMAAGARNTMSSA